MRTFILLSGILLFGLNSCKKYEDDHFIHFRTAKQRIVGKWELMEIELTDGTIIRNANSSDLIFTNTGDYISQNGNSASVGNWSFIQDRSSIYTRINQFGFTEENTFEILKLSNIRMSLKEESGTIIRYKSIRN